MAQFQKFKNSVTAEDLIYHFMAYIGILRIFTLWRHKGFDTFYALGA